MQKAIEKGEKILFISLESNDNHRPFAVEKKNSQKG